MYENSKDEDTKITRRKTKAFKNAVVKSLSVECEDLENLIVYLLCPEKINESHSNFNKEDKELYILLIEYHNLTCPICASRLYNNELDNFDFIYEGIVYKLRFNPEEFLFEATPEYLHTDIIRFIKDDTLQNTLTGILHSRTDWLIYGKINIRHINAGNKFEEFIKSKYIVYKLPVFCTALEHLSDADNILGFGNLDENEKYEIMTHIKNCKSCSHFIPLFSNIKRLI